MNNIVRSVVRSRDRLVTVLANRRQLSDNKNDKSVTRHPGTDQPKRINVKDRLASIKESLVVKDVDNMLVDWYKRRPPDIPKRCDVVIIGGGAMGSSIAYWLRNRLYSQDFSVVVVERDPMYSTASTVLSLGGLRQQFSVKENIEMSLFGAEFVRNMNQYLGIEGQPAVDPCYHPYGYLVLASEMGASKLIDNSKLQNFLGAKNIILSAAKLRQIFPWLDTTGVEMGCLGLEKEGWFDPWAMLSALKKKAMILGAEYVTAEAQGFLYKKDFYQSDVLDQLVIKTKDGQTHHLPFAIAIVAAGAFSGNIARMAKLGSEESDLRSIQLPVEPRKRYVYCFHCPDGPGLNTPLTIDLTGTYFRREGLANTYVCGRSPEESEEPSIDDLNVDYDYFEEKVWPVLARRVPAFEKLKLKSSWAGYYEYNTLDQNGIIGHHPYYSNLLFATGFSGHGIQQAPAVGRAIAELIVDGRYMTIDLTNFGFDRVVKRAPVKEINVY